MSCEPLGEAMRRREFITLVGGAAVCPLAARAQEAGRAYRLGCLLPLSREAPINVAFFDELRRRGFIEGQNLTIEYRAYGLHPERISEYAAELVKARVDVITIGGTIEAIRAAQQATKTIPILAMSDDMVGSGLAASMARPNGNTTGVSILAATLDGKRQEILIEALPGLRRIAFLVEANTPTVAKLDTLQEAARAHNIYFQSIRWPKARRSQQPLTQRRRQAPQR
jgi:putative ABC transport system substrate-binding protein